MVARITTVAFQGFEVLDVDVQVQMSPGLPAFTVVGLPDKAVAKPAKKVELALEGLAFVIKNMMIIRKGNITGLAANGAGNRPAGHNSIPQNGPQLL